MESTKRTVVSGGPAYRLWCITDRGATAANSSGRWYIDNFPCWLQVGLSRVKDIWPTPLAGNRQRKVFRNL